MLRKKSKISTILLATVWISYADVKHGISSAYLQSVQSEGVYVQTQQNVVTQRLELMNKISENIFMAGEGEKYNEDQQQAIASAILVSLLSSPTALQSFTGASLTQNAIPLTKAIKTTLQSLESVVVPGAAIPAVSSIIETVQTAMAKSIANNLKDGSGRALNIKADSIVVTTQAQQQGAAPAATNTTTPISTQNLVTRLIYAGQDLSEAKYAKLDTLEITVAQLRSLSAISAPRALNVFVLGDAGSQEIDLSALSFPIKVLDLSNVTGVSKINALRGASNLNIDAVYLPKTVTHLKINQNSRILAFGEGGSNLPKLQ